MATDTPVNTLIINRMKSKEQYESLPTKDPTQLYLAPGGLSVSVTDNPDGTKIIRMGKTVIITGRANEASVGAGVATHTAPITLPVTMANDTYTVLLTPTCGGGLAQLNVDYDDETTTEFTIGLRNVGSTTSTDININWVVIGDIAE